MVEFDLRCKNIEKIGMIKGMENVELRILEVCDPETWNH